jgi:hypothetical protein
MGTHRYLNRSHLFLVRVWTEESEYDCDITMCHGRVQRAVDGEAHLFDSWQGLIEKLSAMISGASGASSATELGDKGHTEGKGENNES